MTIEGTGGIGSWIEFVDATGARYRGQITYVDRGISYAAVFGYPDSHCPASAAI